MSFNPNEGGPEFASKVYGGMDQQAVGGVGGNAIVTHDIGRQYVGGKRGRKMSHKKWGGKRSKRMTKKMLKKMMGGKRRSRKMRGGCGCSGGTDAAAIKPEMGV